MTKANINGKVNLMIAISAIAAIVICLFTTTLSLFTGRMMSIVNLISRILFIVSSGFWASWAVITHKKESVVLGSLFLFLHRVFICVFGSIGGWQVVCLCLSVVIFVSMCLTPKKGKLIAAISFIVMAIIQMCAFFYQMCEFFSYVISIDTTMYTVLSVCLSAVSSLLTVELYVALGIYIFIDGKPSETKTALQEKYVRRTDATSLEEELKCAEEAFQSGRITAEEYKEQRKNILSRGGR